MDIVANDAIVKTPDSESDVPLEPLLSVAEKLELIAQGVERLQTTAVLQIAEQVAEAHALFRYKRNEGGYAGWMKTRLGYSRSSAYRLLDVHRRFGDKSVPSLGTLPVSAVYLLAAPSTPEEVLNEIAERVAAGEKPRVTEVEAAIKRVNKAAASDRTSGGEPISGAHVKEEIAQAKRKRNGTAEKIVDDASSSAEARKSLYAAADDDDELDRHDEADQRDADPESETLINHWWRVSDEEREQTFLELIQNAPIDLLLKMMSAGQRKELYDRLISLQISLATSEKPSKNGAKLLASLTGTFHWALAQDDPASAAEGLKTIKGKLVANRRAATDLCLAFVKKRSWR